MKPTLTDNQKDMLRNIKRNNGVIFVKGYDVATANALYKKGYVVLLKTDRSWLSGYKYEVHLR